MDCPLSPTASHPSVKAQLIDEFAYEEADVVVHKRLVTSRGPGTAIIFTLRLIELLLGKAKADEVAGPLMLPTSSA
jgi:protein DJ-1